MKITVQAYAKINLLLDIIGRLPNGYHDLHMMMQSVSLCDTLTVEPGERCLVCSDPDVPTDEHNLVWKAAAAFERAASVPCGDVSVALEKRIPSAAGLAGGSADAAAMLAALNELHGTGLSTDELCRIGAEVGADVPFCLTGGTALALNIGDVLAPLPPFEAYTLVLAKPDCAVSTAEAYAQYDAAGSVLHPNFRNLLFRAAKGDWDGVLANTSNIFEQFIEVADRVPIKSVMRRCGSVFSMMSGSGPTVFGVFRDAVDAERCAEELRETVRDVFVCRPVRQGLRIISE